MLFQENISLKQYNTFGIDARAAYFASFATVAELLSLLNEDLARKQNLLVLGGGSNLLLTKNVDGLVLKNSISGIELVNEDDRHYYIKVGAGEVWHRFVMHCVQHGFGGVENLSLIPGSVGASPMQNIGAYGVEIKDVFHELEALHIREQEVHKFGLSDCAFGYRESVFKNRLKGQYIITSVTYRLQKQPVFNTSYGAIKTELERMGVKRLSIAAISQAVINIRTSKLPDPKEIGNAGSFFKNPIVTNEVFASLKAEYPDIAAFPAGEGFTKIAAGWLIEQCGWKGYRRGDAGCYPKQALVLVNYGQATGGELLQLSYDIRESVKKKFGIGVEPEVNVI